MTTNYNNRRYLVIPTSVTSSINFNEVLETSIDTLRLSNDGTKTFVKYNVTIIEEDREDSWINEETGETETVITPAGIYGRPNIYSEQYDEYTHSEMLELLQTEEWTSPNEED